MEDLRGELLEGTFYLEELNSMNYQFTSNQNLEYRTNMTNDFAVEVEPPTDARDFNERNVLSYDFI